MDYKINLEIVKCSNKREDIREIKILEDNIGNIFEIVEIDTKDEEMSFKIYVPEYSRKYIWLSTDEFVVVSNESLLKEED